MHFIAHEHHRQQSGAQRRRRAHGGTVACMASVAFTASRVVTFTLCPPAVICRSLRLT